MFVIEESALISLMPLPLRYSHFRLTAYSSPVRSLIPSLFAYNRVKVAISSAVIESPLDLFKASLSVSARLASGMLIAWGAAITVTVRPGEGSLSLPWESTDVTVNV